MKKYTLLFVFLLLTAFSFAQKNNHVDVTVRLGKMAVPEIKDGKVVPIYTTRAEILKNNKLISTASNCDVTSYTFSIKAEGHALTGPFEIKGDEIPEKIKNKIREWDYPNTQVIIKDIHVTCSGNDHVAYPLFLYYDN